MTVVVTDRQGQASSARIQLPRLELNQPTGEVRLPFGTSTPAARVRVRSRIAIAPLQRGHTSTSTLYTNRRNDRLQPFAGPARDEYGDAQRGGLFLHAATVRDDQLRAQHQPQKSEVRKRRNRRAN